MGYFRTIRPGSICMGNVQQSTFRRYKTRFDSSYARWINSKSGSSIPWIKLGIYYSKAIFIGCAKKDRCIFYFFVFKYWESRRAENTPSIQVNPSRGSTTDRTFSIADKNSNAMNFTKSATRSFHLLSQRSYDPAAQGEPVYAE